MVEGTVHANERDYPWESDEGDPDSVHVLRWRTLISSGLTPTSGLSMGTFEVPPDGVVYHPGDSVHGVRNRGGERVVIVWMFPIDTYDEVEYVDA